MINSIPRRSCLIDLIDTFILTGGFNDRGRPRHLNKVTQYNSAGFVKELPLLNTRRWGHGCGVYYTDNQPVRFITLFYVSRYTHFKIEKL